MLVIALVALFVGVLGVPTHHDPMINAMLQAEYERTLNESKYSLDSIPFRNDTMVCFGNDVGCFSWNETKFSGNLPEDPGVAGINTTFHLYTRDNNDSSLVMYHENEETIKNIPQLKNTEKPLFIVTHGFGGTGRTFWVVWMKDALLKVMDCNVIAVDWRRGSALPTYYQAVANTLSVGRATAKLLADISKIYGYSPKKIHYIGFSMGAQVGGFAGRHYNKLTGTKFGRMTVLDAAAPGFEKFGVHVVKEDAEFTIGLHTSAGDSIITGKVGMVKSVGHIDFYANGGIHQPGCRIYEVKCHHERAPKYFQEAVLNSAIPGACAFDARHCQETLDASHEVCTTKGNEVGVMSLQPTGSGQMYLTTNSAEPWCVNDLPAKFSWV